jgi:long-chain acyl-CoA synthetase
MSWDEALESGKTAPAEPVPPGPDDYCTIMYTSGTTGEAARGLAGRGLEVW